MSHHRLTKSEFMHYRQCPQSLWLRLNDPAAYPPSKPDPHADHLQQEGYRVEAVVKQLFCARQARGQAGVAVDFQRVFETDDLYARADVVETLADGTVNLYEVKSATGVSKDHLLDVSFQAVAAAGAGAKVARYFLIHVNGDYVRAGPIQPEEMLTVSDITAQVLENKARVAREIKDALAYLRQPDIARTSCASTAKSRGHHCDAFAYFNPDVPVPSIYSLPGIQSSAIADLRRQGVVALQDISADFRLNRAQKLVVQAHETGAPVIDRRAIRAFLDGLAFPLWFLDFEAFGAALPLLDGTRPYDQFAVQYSLHRLSADGQLDHFEFLEEQAALPGRLAASLRRDLGPQGAILAWHASFESRQIAAMAAMFPDQADFLHGVNDRLVDLEPLFKTDYVDIRFDGSSSIKKILPVLCPHLNYAGLDVADGTAAMAAWAAMVNPQTSPSQRQKLKQDLLAYCKLDSLAMVEIYRVLAALQ